MNDVGICGLIYVVEFKVANVVREKLSHSILSFTRVARGAEVSGGTTRDLQALPGHLRAFVASAGLTQAFENHGRTGRTADPWSGLAAWDHWA